MSDAHAQIHGFIVNLFDCYRDGWIEIRSIRKPAIEQEWFAIADLRGSQPWRLLCQISDHCLAQDARGFDVYVGVLPRTERVGKSEHVWHAHWIWADLDFEKTPEHEARTRLESHPPTMMVHSGGGLHPYWWLDEPVFLDKRRREKFQRSVCGLIALLGADPAAKDEARVLRVPGTHNHKPKRNNAEARLVLCTPSPWAAAPYNTQVRTVTVAAPVKESRVVYAANGDAHAWVHPR